MSTEKQGISFRKDALQHVSRPVLIDDALQVISPKNWLLLTAIFFVIGMFLAWLIWGKLFIKVTGKGMLMSATGDMITVNAPQHEGVVQTIHVKTGDYVKKNTVLMSMDNDLISQLKLQNIYLNKLKEQQKELLTRADLVVTNLESSQREQINKINDSLSAAQEKLKQLQLMLTLKEKGFKKGILDLPNITETRIEYYKLLQEIGTHEAELIAMRANMVELRDKWRDRESDLARIIFKEEYEAHLLQTRWQQTHDIISPTNGIVAEIRVQEGYYSKPGDVLLSIIPANQDLYALAFVPAEKGKLVKSGMTAQITPTIINKLEYGAIKGRVESSSLLPITSENMMTMLNNQELVKSFISKEPLMSVKILLDKNPLTTSGYQWTSHNGPKLKLTQGTLVDISINVETKHPIDLLIHYYD